ncbi:MAG: hypothetical protein DWQ09_13355 [Proteobacteria bacterium]|nr:MAG: hypothetical protein DWQ09_13355 [Pseudomonadota bacterium]
MLLAGVYFLGDDLTHQVRDWLAPLKGRHAFFLLLAMVLYVLFMALPFVPGIEVGLVVMLVGGLEGIAPVYTATLLALSLSYGLGRLMPVPVLGGVLAWLGSRRAEALVHEMEEMTPSQRMVYLTRQIPSRWLPFFLRHRYLALAIALNRPGNALIGGGGGIGVVTGMSGLFPFPRYLALIAVAVSPVPLMLIANTNLSSTLPG